MKISAKKIFVLICPALLIISYSRIKTGQKKEINILFIGNSLTFTNNMPQMLQKIFDEHKYNYKVFQSTFSGIPLAAHFNSKVVNTDAGSGSAPLPPGDTSETEKVLFSKHWDFVVLQEGTVRLLIPEVKILLVLPVIKNIQSTYHSHVSQFVLFKTWPSLDTFPKQHCYPKKLVDPSIKKDNCCSPMMKSQDEEINLINAAYDTLVLATSLPSVPITNCFADILKNHPGIDLYQDEVHPSKAGAYLNACVFYKYFTKQKAVQIKYTGEVDKTIARSIQEVVDRNYR